MFKSSFRLYNFKFGLIAKSFCSSTSNSTSFTNIKLSYPHSNVGLIQLYRPKAKNALNSGLIKELNTALASLESNPEIGCVVLAGDKDYFAAGADIKEMKDKNYSQVYETSMLEDWNYISKTR